MADAKDVSSFCVAYCELMAARESAKDRRREFLARNRESRQALETFMRDRKIEELVISDADPASAANGEEPLKLKVRLGPSQSLRPVDEAAIEHATESLGPAQIRESRRVLEFLLLTPGQKRKALAGSASADSNQSQPQSQHQNPPAAHRGSLVSARVRESKRLTLQDIVEYALESAIIERATISRVAFRATPIRESRTAAEKGDESGESAQIAAPPKIPREISKPARDYCASKKALATISEQAQEVEKRNKAVAARHEPAVRDYLDRHRTESKEVVVNDRGERRTFYLNRKRREVTKPVRISAFRPALHTVVERTIPAGLEAQACEAFIQDQSRVQEARERLARDLMAELRRIQHELRSVEEIVSLDKRAVGTGEGDNQDGTQDQDASAAEAAEATDADDA